MVITRPSVERGGLPLAQSPVHLVRFDVLPGAQLTVRILEVAVDRRCAFPALQGDVVDGDVAGVVRAAHSLENNLRPIQ